MRVLRCSRRFARAALDGAARARRAGRAGALALLIALRGRGRAAGARGGCRAAGAHVAGVGVARRRARAGAARRRASPASCCSPTRWGELAAGISRGIQALPGVRVPYRGLDPWMRIVIPLGGTVLVVVAALARVLAAAPRKLGVPGLALLLLVVLYAVPAVALDFAGEFLRGAVLALLVLAFLRLERLRGRATCGSPARWRSCVVVGRAAGRARCSTPTRRGSTTRLGARRLGVEVDDLSLEPHLRPAALAARRPRAAARARQAPGVLEGREPRRPSTAATGVHGDDGYSADISDAAGPAGRAHAGRRTSASRSRNLRADQFITAGYAFDVALAGRPHRRWTATAPSARRARCAAATPTRPQVYSPQPTEDERHAAPASDDRIVWRLPAPVAAPAAAAAGRPGRRASSVYVPELRQRPGARRGARRDHLGDYAIGARRARARPVRRRLTLAQRLKRGTHDQEDYVAGGAAPTSAAPSSPTPSRRRRPRRTLDGFLFDAKTGYCQQYSGAMALLLRMGGVPARVSTGFSSGALDRKTRRVRRARLRRPLLGRGLVPRHRLGDVRPDARPPRRRAASPTRRPAPAGGSAAPAELRRRRRSRARRRRRGGGAEAAPVVADPAAGRRRRCSPSPRSAAARSRRWRRRRAAARCRRARARAAPHAPRAGGPGTTLHALELRFAAHARRRGLRARAARAPLRAARRAADPRAAPRRCAPSSAAAHGVARPPARVVGLPPASVTSATRLQLTRHGRRVRPLPARHGAARGRALPPGDRAAREGRELEPEKTSIREALGRAYFRSAPVRGGARGVRGGRRARADQRLRAVLPRPRADAARPTGRGAQAADARGAT